MDVKSVLNSKTLAVMMRIKKRTRRIKITIYYGASTVLNIFNALFQ